MSASTRPATVSGGSCLAVARRTRCSGRRRGPASVAVRGTPMIVRLYLTAGMPARAVLRIIWQMSSICGRAPALAEHDRGILAARDLRRAQRQRHHVERDAERLDALAQPRQPSTDQPRPSRGDGSRLQMWLTPKPASTQDRVGIAVLRADLHAGPRRRAVCRRSRRRLGLDQRFGERSRSQCGASQPGEIATIHSVLIVNLRTAAFNESPPAAHPSAPDRRDSGTSARRRCGWASAGS